jgi:hypothetical protein
MVFLLMEWDNFTTELTLFWSSRAFQVVISIFTLDGSEIAILAYDLVVFFFLVLLFVGFSHAHPTVFTFVVLSRAPYVMHLVFADRDVLVADIATFSFFNFSHISLVNKFILVVNSLIIV